MHWFGNIILTWYSFRRISFSLILCLCLLGYQFIFHLKIGFSNCTNYLNILLLYRTQITKLSVNAIKILWIHKNVLNINLISNNALYWHNSKLKISLEWYTGCFSKTQEQISIQKFQTTHQFLFEVDQFRNRGKWNKILSKSIRHIKFVKANGRLYL